MLFLMVARLRFQGQQVIGIKLKMAATQTAINHDFLRHYRQLP